MEDYAFSVDSFLTLSVECCFWLVQLGAVLVGINHSFFWKELIKEDSLPTPPFIQHHLLSMKPGFWGVGGRSLLLPHDLLCSCT